MTRTSQTSTLRTDLLDEELTEAPKRVEFEHVYDIFVEPARDAHISLSPLKSLGPARELNDCFELIKDAITFRERAQTEISRLASFSYEDPVEEAELEAITFVPTLRLPAMLEGGRPDKSRNRVRELVPHLREEGIDPDHHGYRIAVLGKMYDNWVDFICWGRTNKAAIARANWFEDLIEEYAWYFTMSGVSRIINQGQKERRFKKIGDNPIYGYPVECFIRTEKITRVSEKVLEQIIVQIGVSDS
ncbi:MAG: hypothetical protein ACXABY_06665 [Candidatus Thorarchaeota archaeon]|jgi:hypothetical protein